VRQSVVSATAGLVGNHFGTVLSSARVETAEFGGAGSKGHAEPQGLGAGVAIAETACVLNLFCANLISQSRHLRWPATRSAVHFGTWLRSLRLGGSTALAACVEPVALRVGITGGLVGVGDASDVGARQGVMAGGVRPNLPVPEAAIGR
jgi:hypothetical protein